MNTREREVMDALATALREYVGYDRKGWQVPLAGASDALAAYDALLTEGSASSEGAEAVVRIDVAKLYSLLLSIGTFADLKGINFEGRPISDAVAEAIGELSTCPPQPAQGEQCSALEVFRIAGGDVECTPNPTAAVAMDCLRDLRQCYDEELSKPERRPIADEVLEPPYFVEVDKNGCAACGHERSWAVVGPGDVAEGQSWLDEEEADRVCERMNAAYYAGRESALPRGLPCVDCAYNPGLCDEHNNGGRPLDGLPAGSDAKPIDMLLFCPECGEQHVDAPEEYERDEGLSVRMDVHWTNPPHRSHLCHACECIWRPSDVATNGVAKIATRGKADTWDATAQQPSCGQDARDAARYQWLKENAHAGFMQSGRSWAVLSSSTEFRTWEQCDVAIDAAIAAQQRSAT